MPEQRILLNDFNLGGISDSILQGQKNSLASCVGIALHDNPGFISANQRLLKESGSNIDQVINISISCSDGNSYLFGETTGKIWKRTSAGVYSLEATDANGGILGATEYQGYVYYASATKLGRWQIGSAWSTRNDSWATFTNGDTGFHPMLVKNMILYIGDKNYLAQVDAGVFTANALDLESMYRIKCLGEIDYDVLIGTYISENVNYCKIFRWNTISLSFTSDDTVPEREINCFIPVDNYVLVQAGRKGNLYTYNGVQLVQMRVIPGDWSGTNEATIYPNAAINYLTLPMFAISVKSGTPLLEGIYSLGGYSSGYPVVINHDLLISTVIGGIQLTALWTAGSDILVAWKNGTDYGVSKVDYANKEPNAYIETRVINIDRSSQKEFDVKINYLSMPAGCSITLYASINFGAYVAQTLVQDTDRKCYYIREKISNANTLQLKVALNVSGNYSPELESIEVFL